MADNLIQRSVTTSVARNLASTTKTAPQLASITPRHLLMGIHHKGRSRLVPPVRMVTDGATPTLESCSDSRIGV